MASSVQTLDVEVELKSPADKLWNAIRDSASLFPKAFPDQYKSIEVLEGDGKSAGSVRLINYADGNSFIHSLIIMCVYIYIHVVSSDVFILFLSFDLRLMHG